MWVLRLLKHFGPPTGAFSGEEDEPIWTWLPAQKARLWKRKHLLTRYKACPMLWGGCFSSASKVSGKSEWWLDAVGGSKPLSDLTEPPWWGFQQGWELVDKSTPSARS